jgi:acetyl-CoA carboxylase biotin carboxyl carrier protein
MDFKEIRELLRLVNQLDLTEVEITQGEFKVRVARTIPQANVVYAAQQVTHLPAQQPQQLTASPAPVAELPRAEAPKVEAPSASLHTFRSPMIGTFYRTPNPETPPFVNVGDEVKKGKTICIVEAMKLFNEIESDVQGKIVKVLVENAQPVEYDQPLFLIDTSM